jgi:membrane associated rhomboid family serine protease
MSAPGAPPPSHPGVAACVRHPDRATGLTCTRCGRPACPECLREASVGYQCVDCVGHGAQQVRRARTPARPLIVPALVAINVLIFVLTAVQAGSVMGNANSDLFDTLALVPGAAFGGEWWRVLTAGFLHIGPIHLLFNMYALWVLGRDLEMFFGRARFLALYFGSLLGGSAAVLLFSPAYQAVAGASGAIFGLMAALVLVLRRLRLPRGQVVAVIVVNLVLTFTLPGLSIAAHLGGLVTGALLTLALTRARL